MRPNLRDELRIATRPSHEKLDRLISQLDVATRPGLAAFSQIHLACFTALRRQAVVDDTTRTLLLELTDALAQDLAILSPATPMPSPPDVHITEGLAAAYVVGGSRLGTKVLRTRWLASTDPDVKLASAYFNLSADGAAWNAVRDDLSGIAPDSQKAQTIVQETSAIFTMFTTVFHQVAIAAEPRNAP